MSRCSETFSVCLEQKEVRHSNSRITMVQFQNNSGTQQGANGMRLAHGHSAFRRADANITVPLNAPDDPVSGYYSNSGTAGASSGPGWFHLPRHVNDIPARPGRRPDHRGVRASRADLLAVLSDVRHALLRASYHADQVEGSLLRAALSCGSSGSSGLENPRVERCDCPPGYQGMSCERCTFGYVRAPPAGTGGGGGSGGGGGEESSTALFECMRCNCNGHAATCDPQTGACSGRDCPYYGSGSESRKNGKKKPRKILGAEDSQKQYPPCMHNTTGQRCDMCADGYHGNATRGAASDCSRCSCPGDGDGGARSFSPRCEALRGGGYRCTQCVQGHAGDHCERNRQAGYRPPPIRMLSPPPVAPEVSWRSSGSDALSDAFNMCEPGYFGKPMEGSQCEPCRCTGGTCDPDTGRCLQCPGNTEGWRCERCLPAHYGDPAASDCKPCNCYGPGSLTGDSCDADNGQCMCRAQFIGRTCDQCKAGHGNLTAGCPPCSCDSIGAASKMCDPVTGQCNCQRGVMGIHCNLCEPEHFGFSPTGCEKSAWCVPETPPNAIGMGDGSMTPVRRRRRRRRKRAADANKGARSRASPKAMSRSRRFSATQCLDSEIVIAGEDGGEADAEADAADGDAEATVVSADAPAVETSIYNPQNRAHVVTAARAATAADNAICAATNAVVAASGAASDAAAAASAYASGFFCFNNPRARPHSVPARSPPQPYSTPPSAGPDEPPYVNQYRYPHRYNSVCRPTTS